MRFSDGTPGFKDFGLFDAVRAGYPPGGGIFVPKGEADLRFLVYGPELPFAESIGLAAATLFPDDLDPQSALDLASAAFPFPPPAESLAGDLYAVDLSGGPTGKVYDHAASFVAALLGLRGEFQGNLGVAALESKELSSLAAAFSRRRLNLVGLCPEVGLEGIEASLLARNGGSLHLVGIGGDPMGLLKLERKLSGLSSAGRALLPLGHGSPGAFAGRVLLLISVFMAARRGIAGELYLVCPPDDIEALATALWVWNWGLPLTGLILPEEGSMNQLDPAGALGGWGQELYRLFRAEHPSSSLVMSVRVSDADLADEGGEAWWGDRASALALAAARRAFAEDLAGHARIIVPRFSRGERAAGPALALAVPDRVAGAEPESVAKAIASLPGLGA